MTSVFAVILCQTKSLSCRCVADFSSTLVEKPLQTVNFDRSILRVIDSHLYGVQCIYFLERILLE
jgi:hypothetical protein